MNKLVTFSSSILFKDETKNIFNNYNTDNIFFFYHQFEKMLALDRFGYANKYTDLPFYSEKTLSTFPSFTNSLTFKECVEKKAKEIIEKANSENKKIAVSYSGGIDSTMIVTAFLLYGVKPQDLTILYSTSSVTEYPWFFEHLKSIGVKCIQLTNILLKKIYEVYSNSHILVFGFGGDCLFGSTIIANYGDLRDNSFQDWCRACNASDNVIAQFEDIVSHYGFSNMITTEFLWWLSFSIEQVKMCYKPYELFSQNLNSFEIFYNAPYFDDWSCCHFDDKKSMYQEKPEYYRLEQKEIIYEYTKDEDYTKTKNKVASINIMGLDFDKILNKYVITEIDGAKELTKDEVWQYFSK